MLMRAQCVICNSEVGLFEDALIFVIQKLVCFALLRSDVCIVQELLSFVLR